uniref:Phytocyanin domain-containing protein n=1 Tax=Quercus lobata TaxID=97700 RepID=A0A7N2L0N4_QUELO
MKYLEVEGVGRPEAEGRHCWAACRGEKDRSSIRCVLLFWSSSSRPDLLFNFMSNVHDVATVSRADYDACAVDNTLTRETTGPYNYTINSTGTHYIICTVANGGHCLGGQKLSISVGNSTSGTSPASSPTGSSTPSGSPTSPTPTGSPTSPSDSPSSTETPAGSSSASSLAATLPLVFMTIALAFFY